MSLCNLSVFFASSRSVIVSATGQFGDADMDLPIGIAAFQAGLEAHRNGQTIQAAFPSLNATQREFLMTGMSEKIQQKIFGHGE